MSFFDQQAAWVVAANVGVAIMLVLIFVPLGLPGRIKFLDKTRLPEGDWRQIYSRESMYSRESIETFLGKIHERGTRRYRRALVWDIPFALLFSASLVALVDALLARSLDGDQEVLRWAVGTPVVYALFDIAEDVVLLLVTNGNNVTWAGEQPSLRVGEGVIRMARTFTRLKFVFVGLSLLVVVWGAVSLSLFGPGT